MKFGGFWKRFVLFKVVFFFYVKCNVIMFVFIKRR